VPNEEVIVGYSDDNQIIFQFRGKNGPNSVFDIEQFVELVLTVPISFPNVRRGPICGHDVVFAGFNVADIFSEALQATLHGANCREKDYVSQSIM